MKKFVLLYLCSFCIHFAFAQQQTATHELGLITENDAYISEYQDKYYTNGIFLFYRYLAHTNKKNINKKIVEFKVGQQIYNPYHGDVYVKSMQDRPFAGYLFAQAGINKFYQNESVLKLSGQLGILGPGSGAEEVQESYHQWLNFYTPAGWQYQIQNSPGVQLDLFYSKKICPSATGEQIDLNGFTDVQAGTIHTSATVGFLSRFSVIDLLPIFNSNVYGASVGKNSAKETEAYFYISPRVNYTLYDATIQGSMFDNNSPVVFGVVPFRFNVETGVRFRFNKVNLSYSVIFNSKEVDDPATKRDQYGSISLSVLM
ncbi:MAG TPA: lipid A deacylase LpxR family protein [Ferruginibacter sp.]|jgi:lipid A 3-O-deacylase|nr:lipid A deacylase LpxR family protein [Ferruginibacter sp.]